MLSFNEWIEEHPEVKSLDKQQQYMLYDEYLEGVTVYLSGDQLMD